MFKGAIKLKLVHYFRNKLLWQKHVNTELWTYFVKIKR